MSTKSPFTYIMLYKPVGVITSANDQYGRKTVVDFIRNDISKRVYPVGRLDYNTAGLILLTDDGDYAYRATHPKHGVHKTYEVICDRAPGAAAIDGLRNGVVLDDGYLTAPAEVCFDRKNPKALRITIREGRNRQIRKMIESCGCNVKSLTRISIGGLSPAGLAPGEWRIVSRAEAWLIFEARPHIIKYDIYNRA
jgi:23S rRNA pseudouridine2605 synthase